MREDFVLLARSAAFDVVGDPLFHFWPPIFFLCPPKSLVAAWVSCCWVVMHKSHDASFYFEDRGYDDLSFRCGGGGCYCEFFFGKYYDIFIVGFSFVGTWRS